MKNQLAVNRKVSRVIFAGILIPFLMFPVSSLAETIRVGYFENPPACFTGQDGRPKGIFVEVLEVIAAEEGWLLEYHPGVWDECLRKLDKAEIDLLLSMVISDERSRKYQFSQATIVNNWAQIFVPDRSTIQSLLDLKGKRVATLRSGYHTDGPEGMRVLNEKFQLGCRLILEDGYAGILNALKTGRADAAVLNRFITRDQAKAYSVRKTGIVFAPTDARFAMPRDGFKTSELALKLDRRLLAMVRDNDSKYYEILEKYLRDNKTVKELPGWFFWLIAGAVGGALLFFIAAALFRQRLNVKTRELRESERGLTRLIENIQVGIVVHGKNSQILECNSIAEKILGLRRDQLLGLKAMHEYWKLIREDGSAMPLSEFPVMRVLAEKEPVFGIVVGIRNPKEDSITWGLVHGIPELDENGDVRRVINTIMDITDLKNAERSLELEKKRLASLLEKFPGYIYLQAPDYSIRFANRYFVKQFGDPTGRFCHETLRGRKLPCKDCPTFKVFDAKAPQTWEWNEAPDGREYAVYDHLFLDSDGSELVLEIGVDITESKRLERKLAEAVVDLELAQRIAAIGNWSLDPAVGVPAWSDQVYRIYERDPALGPPNVDDYKQIFQPDQYDIFRDAIQSAISNGTPYDINLELTLPDGRLKWIHAICRPDQEPGPAGHILRGTIQDVSEAKRAEEKLHEYSNQLEEMVEERTRELKKAQEELLVKERLAVLGHFAGSISHELRNPLAAIDSSVYFLKMKHENGDEVQLRHLERISKNVTRSTAIIQSLLNLSRMEKPETVKMDLVELVADILRTIQIPDTVEVRLDSPEQGVSVDIDAQQVRMALKNVIRNAVQAMEENGKLAIRLRTAGDDCAELSVADTGPGIAPEHHEKVFEPLFSTKTHGIGFGLSITKMIVENHGGTVWCESEPGTGTTIRFLFPVSGAVVSTGDVPDGKKTKRP